MRVYRHRRPTIGVLAGWQVYGGTLDSFVGHVFRGIQAAARDRGCNLLLACGASSPNERGLAAAWPILAPEVDFVPVGAWNTDGLIALTPLVWPEAVAYCQDLIARGHPLVYAGAGESGPKVMVDNAGGIQKALQHLAAHGHSRIAFLAGDSSDLPDGDNAERLDGYHTGVRRCGLPYDPELIAHVGRGGHTTAGGREAMQELLARGVSFTAVVTTNDDVAEGAIEVLMEAGLSVPQDVAVIGFDDRLEARATTPALTTVRHPMFEMGYQSVELLLRYMDGEAPSVETVRIPTQLVIRESCGCLPGCPRVGSQEREGRQPLPPVVMGKHGPPEEGADAPARLAAAMSAAVSAEMQRLSQDEVDGLCRHLADALSRCLRGGDVAAFRTAVQQVLLKVAAQGDAPHAWQAVVSVLRSALPQLVQPSGALTLVQAEAVLDQARVAISEVTRGQYTRHLIRQADIAERVGQMTARFLAAQSEAEVLHILAGSLPSVGIRHAAVVRYEPEGDAPFAWSALQPAQDPAQEPWRFPSQEFPPPGLYPEDEPFSLALLPLVDQDGLTGYVAFDGGNLEPCADIARQVAAALRSVRLYREAVEGRRLAEEANRLKSRFLSVVSHELRTPLNLISGLSDILLQESESAPEGLCEVRREDVERIYVSAQHLDGLIRDVLDLAQSEVGQLKLACEPLDPAEVLAPVSVIGEHLAGDKGLAWRFELPKVLPRVWGDRTRLRQVALNLVNNAVKFTAHGKIALIVSADDAEVRVAVHDTGLGIPVEEQEVIFDEFRQSERTTARGYGGLGLGLAICKRLVEMHGGEIGVCSSGEEGGGSSFFFTLPAMARSRLDLRDLPLHHAQHVVLLVRDTAGGEILRGHLQQRGFEVTVWAVNGSSDWLAWLLAGPPGAVVLDLGLASERGWEILRILKDNPATRDVPVLFYALQDSQDSGSTLELSYLTKPVGSTELVDALVSRLLVGAGREHKVLLVDDEPQALEMYARILQAQNPGQEILRAGDGREALEVIARERPDLVLLDLMMPELDGFGVLEAMQDDEASRNIPVIVLTGQSLTQEDMVRLNHGVARVLGKGLFTVEETLAHIEATLEGRQRLGNDMQRVVRKAIAFIHSHFAEPISRTEIASYVGVSERHLSRCFRQEMHVTLSTYLNRYRVNQARMLLQAGGRSITEVAMDVGFSTGGYFTRVFRQEVGVSPSAYMQGERA